MEKILHVWDVMLKRVRDFDMLGYKKLDFNDLKVQTYK